MSAGVAVLSSNPAVAVCYQYLLPCWGISRAADGATLRPKPPGRHIQPCTNFYRLYM